MKLIAWLTSIWVWFTSSKCHCCRQMRRKRELDRYLAWVDLYFCEKCLRAMREDDARDTENMKLAAAVEEEKRRLRARKIAERELSRENYRGDAE